MTLAAGAAIFAALLIAAIAVFQMLLALGAPLGAYAWGGQHEGVLPQRLRIGSALSAPLLIGMAAVALIRGGVLAPAWQGAMGPAVWVIFVFLIANTVANWRSKSEGERRMMTPVTAVLAILLLVLQFSA